MEENQLWSLIAKKISGEATPEDLVLLEELLARNGAASIQSEVLSKIWDLPIAMATDTGKANTWDNIRAMMEREEPAVSTLHPQRRFRRTRWLIAASLIAMVLIGSLVIYPGTKKEHAPKLFAQHEVVTENGSRSEMTLPDGSKVILNSGSRIGYDKEFGTSNRSVTITGEAFFDVAHNPGLPFVVTTKNGTIRVLGTAFNVRSYPDEAVFETSLLRGKVELELPDAPGKIIRLRPMEKIKVSLKPATISDSSGTTPSQTYTISNLEKTAKDTFQLEEVSWIRHKYVFKGEKFELLARKIEKWYGVKLIFEDETIKEKIFTGVFDDLSLEEALKALVFSSGNEFNYSITNNQVTINNMK